MSDLTEETSINYDWFYYIVLITNVIAIFFPIILVIIFIIKEKKRTIFSFLDFYLYLGCIFHSACYFVPPFKFTNFEEYKYLGGKIQGVLAMSINLFALTILACISFVTYTNFTNPTFFLNNKLLYIISIHIFIFGIPITFMTFMFATNAPIAVGISRYCWGQGGGYEIAFYGLIFILYAIALVYIIKLNKSVGTFITDCGNDTSYESQVKTVKHYYLMIIFSIIVLIIEVARLILDWSTLESTNETSSLFYGIFVVFGDLVEQIMFPIFVYVFGFTETRFVYFKELICCQKNSNILTDLEETNQINLVERKEEDDDIEIVEHEEEEDD